MLKKKCIFLDRDGTINVYKCLLHKKEDLELEYKVEEAIRLINASEYLSIVVSNPTYCSQKFMYFRPGL